jgi:low affinity Fe/Cu permease
VGHKIGEQNRQIADLEAKLDTKGRLLDEALEKIKGIHEDSTEKTEIETEDQE